MTLVKDAKKHQLEVLQAVERTRAQVKALQQSASRGTGQQEGAKKGRRAVDRATQGQGSGGHFLKKAAQAARGKPAAKTRISHVSNIPGAQGSLFEAGIHTG